MAYRRGSTIRRVKGVRVLLIDLDGTLYFRGRKIPGADQAIDDLRRRGFVLRFLSNTDSKSVPSIVRNVRSLGLPLSEEEVFSPAMALKLFAAQQPGKKFHLLLSSDLVSDLRRSGITSADVADYVVVGDVRECADYEMLDRAFRIIMSGAQIIGMQQGRYSVGPDGYHIDTGAFVRLLEYASGKEAIMLGKPSQEFFGLALQSCTCSPDEAAVVGDDVSTDIAGARAIGSLAILVRTGKAADMNTRPGDDVPDIIIDSIADLPRVLPHPGNPDG
jgi:HAD superfamily hydrolase (TIGR01458 family)